MSVVFPLRLLVRALLSLALPIGLVSCASDTLPTPEMPEPVPDVVGTIRPANAATSIEIIGATGKIRTIKPDTTTGVFTVLELPTGNYDFKFISAPGYNPTTRTTTTVRGLKTDIGVVTLQYNAGIARGESSWIANDISYTSTYAAGFVAPAINRAYITFSTQPNGAGEFLKLVWDPGSFHGVGTYSFGLPPVKINAGYILNQSASFGNIGPPDLNTGAIGSVTVTQFDPSRGIVAGTFAFEAPEMLRYLNAPPSDQSVVIKAGRFSVRYVPAP